MKYTAILMVPEAIEFESAKGETNITNAALALCKNFQSIDDFEPKLLSVQPKGDSNVEPLVFDPPPMVA